jgi:hypothetical protein
LISYLISFIIIIIIKAKLKRAMVKKVVLDQDDSASNSDHADQNQSDSQSSNAAPQALSKTAKAQAKHD